LPLRHLAPEAISELRFTKATDVWSFGCLLYEIFTGHEPYPNIHSSAVVDGVKEHVLSIGSLPPTTPVEMKKLLQECHNIIPESRPPFINITNTLQIQNTDKK